MTNPNVGFNVISTTSHINGTGEYGIGYCNIDETSEIQGKLNITPLFTIKYKSELDNSPEKLSQFQADLLKTELIDFLNWKFPLGIPAGDSEETVPSFMEPGINYVGLNGLIKLHSELGYDSEEDKLYKAITAQHAAQHVNKGENKLRPELKYSSDEPGSAQIPQEQLAQENNTNTLFPTAIPFYMDPITKTTKSDLNDNQLKLCRLFNRWKRSVIGNHIYCCWCESIQFILIFDPETTVISDSGIIAQVRLFYLFNDVNFFVALMGGRQSNILHFEDVLQSGHGGDLYQYNAHFEDKLLDILSSLAKI